MLGEEIEMSTGRGGFKEKLEMVTNIMVIASVLVSGFLLYRSYTNTNTSRATRLPEPAAGTVLPALPGYRWDGHSHILLLALRKGCRFCEESMPFYRELLKAEKSGGSKAHLVSVLPDPEMDATRLLHDAQLDLPIVTSFQLQRLHVSATPTLILVDGNGTVEKTWVGKQDAAGQQAILDAIRE
jgi:hypothetical protein